MFQCWSNQKNPPCKSIWSKYRPFFHTVTSRQVFHSEKTKDLNIHNDILSFILALTDDTCNLIISFSWLIIIEGNMNIYLLAFTKILGIFSSCRGIPIVLTWGIMIFKGGFLYHVKISIKSVIYPLANKLSAG